MPTKPVFNSDIDRALYELEGLNRFMGGTTPQPLLDLIQRSREIIDAYSDSSAEEKEAITTAMVLSFGAPFIFDDTTRFSTEYKPLVAPLIEDLMNGKVHENPLLAQIELALSTASAEDGLAHADEVVEVNKSEGRSAGDVRQMIRDAFTLRTDNIYASCPRLVAAEAKALEALDAELQKYDTPGLSAPGIKPPKGPRF